MIYPKHSQTSEAVADHYNSLDQYYRKFWGEHLHHGFWEYGTETIENATEKLIELVAKTGNITSSSRVCDIGCGYGATSRYLTKKKEARLTALTVSKTQWQYARTHDPESTNPRYILGDFLHNDFPEGTFDVVISIESSEHMVDKKKFFEEVTRILKPGGRFVTCVWLAKEHPKNWEAKYLLEPICREGRLPSMGSEKDYYQMMESAGMNDITFKDISKNVKKTWSICGFRVFKAFFFDPSVRKFLLDKRATNRIFAKTLFRIWIAYQMKAMRYGIFRAIKPQ